MGVKHYPYAHRLEYWPVLAHLTHKYEVIDHCMIISYLSEIWFILNLTSTLY